MKILHVIPGVNSESGGPVRSSLASVKAVHSVDGGCEQLIATTDYGLSPQWLCELRSRIGDAGRYRVFPKALQIDRGLSVPMLTWLLEHGREYDLLVLRYAMHPVISTAAWAARKIDLPYVLTPHGCLSEYTFEHRRTALKRLYFRVVERHTVAGAAAVQCTCQQEAEELRQLGVDCDIRIIPHPYTGPVRNSTGSESGLRLLFLSRLHPMKGLDVLLPAFAEVVSHHPDAELVVAGSGEPNYEKKIKRRTERLDIVESVSFPGFVTADDKEDAFDSCDVFILPSQRENYGIAVVEAMARGLPVVISGEVGIARDIERAGAGLVIDRSPDEIARATNWLLASREERERMGRAGVRLVRDQFDAAEVGTALRNFYRKHARGRKSQA